MRFRRRTALKQIILAAAGTVALVLGPWRPKPAAAAEWPRDAYGAKSVGEALRHLYGTNETTVSEAIRVRAPSRVQSGDMVPFSVSANLPAVQSISILVEANSPPLATHVRFTDAVAFLSINVKMQSTSRVHIVVEAGGKLFVPKKNFEVIVLRP